jgi:hypothetical protein
MIEDDRYFVQDQPLVSAKRGVEPVPGSTAGQGGQSSQEEWNKKILAKYRFLSVAYVFKVSSPFFTFDIVTRQVLTLCVWVLDLLLIKMFH